MSRTGRNPIPLPKGVEIKIDGKLVRIKGHKGALEVKLMEGITAEVRKDSDPFTGRGCSGTCFHHT